MNLEAAFRWLCWGWFAAEAFIAISMRTRRTGGTVRDRGSQLLIWAAITTAIFGADWVQKIAPWSMFHDAEWLRPASLAVLVTGLVIRAVAILTLGRAFSVNVAIRDEQKVQRGGLYRFVRHPSYLGMEVAFLAIGLHSRNWACLAFIFALPTLAILYRIHVEEAALHEAFGEEYAGYTRATNCLIPGVF
jgi:protein-S-isoprenylcysteine O-methyltransferase Ste14